MGPEIASVRPWSCFSPSASPSLAPATTESFVSGYLSTRFSEVVTFGLLIAVRCCSPRECSPAAAFDTSDIAIRPQRGCTTDWRNP